MLVIVSVNPFILENIENPDKLEKILHSNVWIEISKENMKSVQDRVNVLEGSKAEKITKLLAIWRLKNVRN